MPILPSRSPELPFPPPKRYGLDPPTPTEFRLLRYLVSRPNRPVSRERLIEVVWGYEDIIGSTRTVDVHVRHLREKIEQEPAEPRWIVTVRGVGYKFQPE